MTPHSGWSDSAGSGSAPESRHARADHLYAAPRPLRKQRLLLWLAAGIVLAFELYMLWLARAPQVDDHYRRYFIEHATTCYRPQGEVPVLSLGDTYPVRKGEVLGNCAVLWAGFYSPKDDRPVGARLAQTTLRLKMTPGLKQPVIVALDMSRFPDSAEPLPVEVIVDGRLLARWPVGGQQARFEVELSDDLIGEDGSVSLTLKGPPPMAPRDLGQGANKFPVGLRLDAVTLRNALGLTPPVIEPGS